VTSQAPVSGGGRARRHAPDGLAVVAPAWQIPGVTAIEIKRRRERLRMSALFTTLGEKM